MDESDAALLGRPDRGKLELPVRERLAVQACVQ